MPSLNGIDYSMYPQWPWPGHSPDMHPGAFPGVYYDPSTQMLIQVPEETNQWIPPWEEPTNPSPLSVHGSMQGMSAQVGFTQEYTNQPEKEEEMPAMDKDEIRKRLRRARRGYDLYRDRDADETDCFDFPTYAKLFHGVTLKQAEKYWKNGDI